MGAYINPPNETKESFLIREGDEVSSLDWSQKPDGTLPVVLINNGMFTAAGIAYDERELVAFTRSDDFRPKRFIMFRLKNYGMFLIWKDIWRNEMLQLWCIECEKYVHVHKDIDGRSYFHTKFINSSAFDPVDVDTCEGPFVFSEPPQLEEGDWDLIFRNEPSEEEIQKMDEEVEL